MRIPKSEFTDADLKLCRAHGASVAHGRVMTASQPHDDAEWSRRWERAEAIAAFETEICMPADLPLPPSYDEDLEHWLKTLAPAKPAAPQPCKAPSTRPISSAWRFASDVPVSERVGLWHIWTGEGSDTPSPARADFYFNSTGVVYRVAAPGVRSGDPYDESKYATAEPAADVWHSEAPSVPGVYIASAERCKDVLSYWDGSKWHCGGAGNAGDARKQTPRKYFPVEWLRLIEADAPAKPLPSASSFASTSSAADGAALVGAKLTHSVCIKAHHGVEVGRVVDGSRPLAYPKWWLPCDAAGWIPHTPTADSVCPVPDGVRFEARYGDGTPVDDTESTKHGDCIILWRATTGSAPCNDIVAWRPIAKDA